MPRLSIFLLSCQHIFSSEKAVCLIKRFTAAANALQHLMTAKATINPLDHAACDVGAMIADPFKIIQKIGPDKACFNSAGSLLHATDMARAKLLFEIINDLLQRLHLFGSGKITGNIGIISKGDDLTNCVCYYRVFFLCCGRKGNSLSPHFLRCFQNIDAVVCYAFKIPDKPQVLRCKGAVVFSDLACAELYQIAADDVLIMVGLCFVFPNMTVVLFRIFPHAKEAFPQRLQRIACHVGNKGMAALQC